MIFFDKVAVLGAGLLGASFALALRRRNMVGKLSVWSRSESTREKCAERKDIFDIVTDSPEEAVKDADLVLICTPTDAMGNLASRIAKALKRGALVSDVGSVKGIVCASCKKALLNTGAIFVGSHPMAGSEKIGVEHAQADLFDGRPCFVMSEQDSNKIAVKTLVELWSALGMKVYLANPQEHDAIVARVSHLPHLLAVTLCAQSAEYPKDLRDYSGPGFRDCTRVASGSVGIWESICADNRKEILSGLKDYQKNLSNLILALENQDAEFVSEKLHAAKKYRDGLDNAK